MKRLCIPLALVLCLCTSATWAQWGGAAWKGAAMPKPTQTFGPSTVAFVGDSMVGMVGFSLTVTSITQTAGVATASIASHGLSVGDVVFFYGAAQAGYNGRKVITGTPTSGSVTFAVDAATTSPATGSPAGLTLKRHWGGSWWPWANGRLGGTLSLLAADGIAGQTSAQVLARVPEAIATGATYIGVNAGGNDLYTVAGDPAAVFATLRTAWDQVLSAGRVPIAFTVHPDRGGAGVAASNRKTIRQLNHLIREYCREHQEIILVDAYNALIDPANANGYALANSLQADNLHPQMLGADLFGSALATALGKYIVTQNRAPASQLVDGASELFSNPLMIGTSGTVSNVAGNFATGMTAVRWAGTGTWTGSVAARTTGNDGDAYGNNAVLTTASAQAGDVIQVMTGDLVSAATTAGATKVRSIAHVQITGAQRIGTLQVSMQAVAGGVTYTASAIEGISLATGMNDINLYLVTPDLILPGSLTTLNWNITAQGFTVGAVTIKVGRLQVFEVP